MTATKITLRYVCDTGERTYKYKSVDWAIRRARRLVGSTPKIDPDGYAVHRGNGNCLFFIGVTKEQLFPELKTDK